MTMEIRGRSLSQGILVVAEIGNNHEGKLSVARALVERAAACHVDAVKFQTFRTRYFTSNRDPARFDRLRSFELAPEAFAELEQLAHALGLLFISTPLDLGSVGVLEPLVDAFKIASGDNDFYALMAAVARTGKPVIVSSGMSELSHLHHVSRFIKKEWSRHGIDQELAFLHCVSAYPAPPEETNLAAIPLMAAELQVPVGYSDHTIGVEACLAAAAMGARILEKHFTLDKNFSDFRDHKLSADPEEMSRLVHGVRRVERLIGKPEKFVQPSERPVQEVARRSVVAAGDLREGHRVSLEDLTWIRPAGGLHPGEEDKIVGRALKRDIAFGEPILPSDVR
jgi:N,N'-diacetyllegionaminate synthase